MPKLLVYKPEREDSQHATLCGHLPPSVIRECCAHIYGTRGQLSHYPGGPCLDEKRHNFLSNQSLWFFSKDSSSCPGKMPFDLWRPRALGGQSVHNHFKTSGTRGMAKVTGHGVLTWQRSSSLSLRPTAEKTWPTVWLSLSKETAHPWASFFQTKP